MLGSGLWGSFQVIVFFGYFFSNCAGGEQGSEGLSR